MTRGGSGSLFDSEHDWHEWVCGQSRLFSPAEPASVNYLRWHVKVVFKVPGGDDSYWTPRGIGRTGTSGSRSPMIFADTLCTILVLVLVHIIIVHKNPSGKQPR